MVGGATFNRYAANLSVPRPESYREDLTTAENIDQGSQHQYRLALIWMFMRAHAHTIVDRPAFFSELASGAESGWDFSSRWFSPGSTELSSIRTRSIVPVDLNAILCQNEATLTRLYRIVGEHVELYVGACLCQKGTSILHYLI